MELTLPYSKLVPGLLTVASACPSTGVNSDDFQPFTLFEFEDDTLKLTGQNQDYQLSLEVPLEQSTIKDGTAFLLCGSKACDFFKNLGQQDDITLKLDPEHGFLEVRSGQGKYSLRVVMVTSECTLAKFEDEGELSILTVDSSILNLMLHKTIFCASRENYREYLKGVRFEAVDNKFGVIGIDGHRLAVADTILETAATADMAFSLRLNAAGELMKHLVDEQGHAVELRLSQNMVTIHMGDLTFKGRLLKCNYPNVRAVLPRKIESSSEVDLKTFRMYVNRVAGFSNKRLNNITFTFTPDKLQMTAKNLENEIGQASMAVKGSEGMERTINLNADFIKIIASELMGDKASFGFFPPYANTLITAVDEGEPKVKVQYVVSQIVT